MPGTLRLTRTAIGVELRRGSFDVAVDGRSVGTIGWQEAIEVSLEAGHHTLQVRAGRYSSRTAVFELADDASVGFRVHGATLWPLYVASIVRPELAIRLRSE